MDTITFQDEEDQFVIARMISSLLWCLDAHTDADEVQEFIEGLLIESNGTLTTHDLMCIAAVARASKFDPNKNSWQ